VILFCDTSALIKLLISEPGSDQMHQASLEAEAIAVCRLTWAEAMASPCGATTVSNWRPPMNCIAAAISRSPLPVSTDDCNRRPL
jgi:hypothetical protein